MARASQGRRPAPIRVGIGGWNYAPWHETFYPAGMPRREELAYASRAVTAIEINATYYRTQSRASFARWRDETPDGFVFAVKATRYATNRRELASAGESVERFLGSGIAELGDKLGPILWQFAPTKAFDADDFGAFLALLPDEVEGRALRHVLEVRHESFMTAQFLALARRRGASVAFTDNPRFPSIADRAGRVVYARLMQSQAELDTGYPAGELDAWAARARGWAAGKAPEDLSYVGAPDDEPGGAPEAVYVFFIDGAKERAPAAAQALLARL